MSKTVWPPLHVYALAHRCTTCGAEPGEQCNAPNKNGRLVRADRIRTEMGMDPIEHDPAHRMHATRQQAGLRHKRRDAVRAPWPEDREPGHRYDSLGDAWTPE